MIVELVENATVNCVKKIVVVTFHNLARESLTFCKKCDVRVTVKSWQLEPVPRGLPIRRRTDMAVKPYAANVSRYLIGCVNMSGPVLCWAHWTSYFEVVEISTGRHAAWTTSIGSITLWWIRRQLVPSAPQPRHHRCCWRRAVFGVPSRKLVTAKLHLTL